jgi:penicillin-binding protein 3
LKKWIGFLFTAAVLTLVIAGCSKGPTPQDRFSEYIGLWKQQKFASMYEYLSKDAKKSISKQEFVSRYKKIYGDLEVSDLNLRFKKPKEETATLPFSAKMNSIAGPIQFTKKAKMVNEDKNWYVDWNTTYIFPELKKGDKISFATSPPERGQIVDRNGNGMAVNGQVYEVGVVPGKMGEQKDYVVAQLSSLLQMTPDEINQAIGASWVKPDYFVPLKKVALDDQARIAQLIALAPVQTKKVPARVYPYKDAAAQLIGYVGGITGDELTKWKDKGYTSNDVIGKRGLEQVYDEQLRGEPGVKVTIKKTDGTETVLAEKAVANGKDITLTIDANAQQKIFAGMFGEAGTTAAMNPVTGETLALVSSPSFDPNQAVLGFSADAWKALQDNPLKPLSTRFKQTYAPGSTMKPITASIGLAAKSLDPAQGLPISGLKWQKDQSWGNYFVTRVHESSPVNLESGLVLSDNIYFAQTALKIGQAAFRDGLKKFGFEEKIDYPFPLSTSTFGKLDSDILLADSGYGQGQVQMSIVHLLATYTPFVNGGNMVKPVLLMTDQKNQIWKQQVVSSGDAALISGILRKVVGDPSGTAHAADMADYPLAGKTGTAEIKQKQGETGTENGWFVAYNVNSPNLLIAMMVENVQNRGGSQIPVKLVKGIVEGMK